MTAVINGIQYIGGQTSPNEFINNQAGKWFADNVIKMKGEKLYFNNRMIESPIVLLIE